MDSAPIMSRREPRSIQPMHPEGLILPMRGTGKDLDNAGLPTEELFSDKKAGQNRIQPAFYFANKGKPGE